MTKPHSLIAAALALFALVISGGIAVSQPPPRPEASSHRPAMRPGEGAAPPFAQTTPQPPPHAAPAPRPPAGMARPARKPAPAAPGALGSPVSDEAAPPPTPPWPEGFGDATGGVAVPRASAASTADAQGAGPDDGKGWPLTTGSAAPPRMVAPALGYGRRDAAAAELQGMPPADQPPQARPAPPQPSSPRLFDTLRESDADFDACRLALSVLGAGYAQVGPVVDAADPDCGIARPLRITSVAPGVTLGGAPLMRCDTARALALWVAGLRHGAAAMPGAPRLTRIETGPGYACRARVGAGAGTRLSQHALGNAIDITAFRFDDGTKIAVQPRDGGGDLAQAFQRSARASACLWFTTVLGPGSNTAHDDHLHLDIKARKGGWRLCQ